MMDRRSDHKTASIQAGAGFRDSPSTRVALGCPKSADIIFVFGRSCRPTEIIITDFAPSAPSADGIRTPSKLTEKRMGSYDRPMVTLDVHLAGGIRRREVQTTGPRHQRWPAFVDQAQKGGMAAHALGGT